MEFKDHMKRHGLKYILSGAVVATGITALTLLPRGNDTPVLESREETPAEVSDDPTFGPKTLFVEKFVDADGNGEPDNPNDVKRFKATYTERPSGNTMVFRGNGVTHECVDNADFTTLEQMISGDESFRSDKLEVIEVTYPGGTHRFVYSSLNPATINGEVGLELFEQTNIDYAGVKPLFRNREVEALEAVTTDFLYVDGNPSDLTYRVVEEPIVEESLQGRSGPIFGGQILFGNNVYRESTDESASGSDADN